MSTPSESQRFHAMDQLRAVAMLLGVVYHAQMFRMFFGGAGAGPPGMGGGGASRWVEDFLHSFRMPLFFLISGFFGRMMLEKYGTRLYLKKRWTRIGLPLLIGMFTFSPAYILVRDLVAGGPGGGPGMGPPPGMSVGGPPGGPAFDPANLPPPPPGFVPPPLARFDADADGSLDAAEWMKAIAEMPPPPGMGGGGRGPFGGGGGTSWSSRVFGRFSRYFDLHHLWFLWYLLIYVTITPFVARAIRELLVAAAGNEGDWISPALARSWWPPIVLGLVATPALLSGGTGFGWTLGLPGTIFRGFPDFIVGFDPEMIFFYAYFLTGWWLHLERAALPDIAERGGLDLVVGVASFSASFWLSSRFATGDRGASYQLARLAGYSLYSIGGAFTAFCLPGLFQKYRDRPSKVWRYLADTALWVYLIHQPMVILGLAACRPLGLPWYVQTPLVAALATAASLLLYELIIRPTPLVRLFGPAKAKAELQSRTTENAR